MNLRPRQNDRFAQYHINNNNGLVDNCFARETFFRLGFMVFPGKETHPMAKRKRLTPPQPLAVDAATEPRSPFAPGMITPPIGRVAGDAATTAALHEVAQELTAARTDGRLLLRLALETVDDTWLVRDRVGVDAAELDSLMTSLRSHGQRTPIEVAEIAPSRFGLISGWRRVTALRQLHAQTGEARFATVLATLRRPGSSEDAYVAMVEENEIRLGLSYFERARIAAKAVEAGVFASEKIALQRLFAAASRAKRSKIGSFLSLYHGLKDDLRFAQALPERLGLTLARALDNDAALGPQLATALVAAGPESAAAEQAVLAAVLAGRETRPVAAPPVLNHDGSAMPPTPAIRPEIFLDATTPGRLVLSGPGVDAGFRQRLLGWLRS